MSPKIQKLTNKQGDISATIIHAGPERYIVRLTDNDSGNTLPCCIIYRDFQSAYEYAKKCVRY